MAAAATAADVIPVLDIAPLRAGEPGALQRLGAELRRAFTEVGFYFVRRASAKAASTSGSGTPWPRTK